jgi:predicted Zn-dependent peptidase
MTGSAEFVQASVDGVPAFWTQAGDGMLAGLVFRVGRADEPLARGGITHLIEHLVLYPLGADARQHYNGQVDAITTTFLTRGTPEELTGFFRAVCANLCNLPAERLQAEKQVLRTEAGSRRPAITSRLFAERYGAQAYGAVAYPEFGIGDAKASDLTSWARRYFTRGNAALWIAGGPPPSGMELALPNGPAMPAPRAGGRVVPTPAYANAPIPGVSWSAVVERSVAAQTYASVLGSRLRQELRHKRALAYSPAVAYEVRDQDMAHVLAVADGLPEVHLQLVSAFIREIERIATTDVTGEELSSAVGSLRAAADTARGAALRVSGAARDAIMGRPARSVASWMKEIGEVSAADIREVAKSALASSLFLLPPGKQPDRGGVTYLDGRSETAVTGRRIRSADHPLDPSRLVVGEDGVSLIQGQTIRTVRFGESAALLRWPDGGRQLIGRDAAAIPVEPALWRLTKKRAARLDAMVPADRLVTMPPRSPEDISRPWTRRRTRVLARVVMQPAVVVPAGIILVLTLLIVLARLSAAAGAIAAGFILPALIGIIYAGGRLRVRLLLRVAERTYQRQ